MDIYLETLKHQGPARLGKFHIDGYMVPTPNFFHFTRFPGRHNLYLADIGTETRKKPLIRDCSFFELERGHSLMKKPFGLLPDFPAGFHVPRGLAEEAMKETLRIAEKYPAYGAVVPATRYPDLAEEAAKQLKGRPLLAVGGGKKLASNPRLLVEVVSRIREASSPTTALYYPFAPAAMFPVLAYMGVDLFDSADALLAYAKGEYITEGGARPLTGMKELPCSCEACRGKLPQDLVRDRKALLKHNFITAKTIIIKIREALRGDRLREYVEEKAATDAKTMAALRILSLDKYEFLERYTPISSKVPQRYVSQESYHRPEVKRWHRRVMKRYSPPRDVKLSIILPCSARKPYSKSRSHRLFHRYIRRGAGEKLSLVHEVVLTSPLGLVPRELEGVFPAGSYDIPVTGHWSEEEKSISIELLKNYLRKAGTHALAHVDGVYREICRESGAELGPKDILSKKALEHLSERVAEILESYEPPGNDYLEARAICDYQFGSQAWRHLIPPGAKRRGRAFYHRGEQVAAVNPATGLLALTLKGGEMLQGYGRYQVRASIRPPSSNLFSIGVEDAGEEIRPGDEVVVSYEGGVAGVGRAVLSGLEMAEARHGLAVTLRHRR